MKPEKKYYPRPLWFWNAKPTPEGIREIMRNCAERDGYAGFGILPYDACGLEYLGEEYLSLYRVVLEEAKSLGLKICLYDEWWFPSGWAGGILKKRYPDACAKRLDLEEFEAGEEIVLPTDGKLMAVVGMRGKERLDLSEQIEAGKLRWRAPGEGWKVLCFVLRRTDWDHVDFLSVEAVDKFIECTHETYYRNFSEYFGNVIDSVFYDEPQFYGADGRMWTERFNERFEEKYGKSPATLYPALFCDIGEETASARNMLLSLRADLYAEAFPGHIQEWCTAHGVALTGHVDQEEVENPSGMTGDLMKSFRYQDIPGIDEIFEEERGSRAYKIVSSAAVNWNKRLVMTECFGANGKLDEAALYRETMDLYTKGVNYMVPHAVWYDAEHVLVPPELSYRDPVFGKAIPAYSEFCARLSEALAEGGQVNSVAVLYPIESLQAGYTLNWGGNPYFGGPTWQENDYMAVGQALSREINCDFTFLHPDALAAAEVREGALVLPDSIHFQTYRAVVMPGMRAVSAASMKKLESFVNAGGTLVSMTELPSQSAEEGMSKIVRNICRALFGEGEVGNEGMRVAHENGGVCWRLPAGAYGRLGEILGDAAPDTWVREKVFGLQWIRRRAAEDVWYFAALKQPAATEVWVRGSWSLRAVDPRTGAPVPIGARREGEHTVFSLRLEKEGSLLVYGARTN